MTTTKAISISVPVSILIGVIAFFIAAPGMAKSIERCTTPAFLFPYAFLSIHLIPPDGLLVPLFFAQFPAYGLFYGWAWSKHREQRAASWLVSTHLVFGITALVLHRVDFFVGRGINPF